MNKKTLITIGVIAGILIILLVVGKKAGWFGGNPNVRDIEITEIAHIQIVETVAATGKIQPETEVKLSSEVSGEIIDLPIVEGQLVEKGDLLVRINPDLYQSSLQRSRAGLQNVRAGHAQAEASLREAKANYDRNKVLYDRGVISKAEWDKIVAAYEMAQASTNAAYYSMQSAAATVTEATDNLTRTTIYAPMRGTISRLDVELGERVVGTQQMAGTEIVRVANLASMEVVVDVNENDIVKVSVGDSTLVEVDAYLKREFKGVVTEISNSAIEGLTADQVTNFKVKVRILEDSYQDLLEGRSENYSPFRPGMTATVDIITRKKNNVIGVPISAIVITSDTTSTSSANRTTTAGTQNFETVFIKDGNIAKRRVVTTGIQDNRNIEILSGLKEGDVVITGPYNTVTKTLKDGDEVQVANATKPEKS